MSSTIRVVYDHLPVVEVREHRADDRGNIYTLLRPISWLGIVIPAGFESDGASVPRLFWGVVFPSGDTKAMFAAIFHDYIYRTHPPVWDRFEADEAFLQLLLDGGVSALRAYRAYIGVRLFGSKAWNEGGKGSK